MMIELDLDTQVEVTQRTDMLMELKEFRYSGWSSSTAGDDDDDAGK